MKIRPQPVVDDAGGPFQLTFNRTIELEEPPNLAPTPQLQTSSHHNNQLTITIARRQNALPK